MKNIISILFLTLFILFCGCKKEKEKFTCIITNPKDGATVLITNDLTIKLEIKNAKNICPIAIYLDDIFITGSRSLQEIFIIPHDSLSLGKHTIKAVANWEATSSITITVVEKFVIAEESPDFVTFANGQFPKGWRTYTWEIANNLGYSDNYSLMAANYPTALVFANKTMKQSGYVEFYSYGKNIDFFIDDVKAQAIESVNDGNWEKRIFALDSGHHQLKWQAEGVYKYIDDIRFYTSK
jgi:hypothetical protein